MSERENLGVCWYCGEDVWTNQQPVWGFDQDADLDDRDFVMHGPCEDPEVYGPKGAAGA